MLGQVGGTYFGKILVLFHMYQDTYKGTGTGKFTGNCRIG